MLRWVSVAPFGLPVVPDVNWMLIGSSGCSDASRRASSPGGTPAPPARETSPSCSRHAVAAGQEALPLVLQERRVHEHAHPRLRDGVVALAWGVGGVDGHEDRS